MPQIVSYIPFPLQLRDHALILERRSHGHNSIVQQCTFPRGPYQRYTSNVDIVHGLSKILGISFHNLQEGIEIHYYKIQGLNPVRLKIFLLRGVFPVSQYSAMDSWM